MKDFSFLAVYKSQTIFNIETQTVKPLNMPMKYCQIITSDVWISTWQPGESFS